MSSSESSREWSGPAAELVAIARIETTHGRRGEVAADLLTDFPERFKPGLQVLVGNGTSRRSLTVQAIRFHKGRAILKFEGLDSLTESERLRGALVQVPRDARMPLPGGRVYISDLTGCAVMEQQEIVGKVVGWEETGAVPLLRVEGPEGEILIPYTAEICYSVDTARKEIRVKTPQGLRELNVVKAKNKASRSR